MLCTPFHPMVLLIIIPKINGYFIGNIPYFQGQHMSTSHHGAQNCSQPSTYICGSFGGVKCFIFNHVWDHELTSFFWKGWLKLRDVVDWGMFSRGFACEAGFSIFNDHFRRYTPCPDTLIWTIATMQSWQQRRSPLSFRLEAAALLTPPWFMVPVMVSSWFLMGLFWDRIFMHSNISKCKHWVFFLMFLMEVQIFGRVTALDRVNCVFPIHIVNLRNLGLWPRIHRWVA